jgi:hypothetical protein
MTPQELREIAAKATEKEYTEITKLLTDAAKEGNHSHKTGVVSDAVVAKLKKDGFKIEISSLHNTTTIYW